LRLVARVALLAGVLACAKPGDKPKLSCDVAAKQGVTAVIERAQVVATAGEMSADQHLQLAERAEKLAQLAPRLQAVLASRCIDDRWPPASIDCVAHAMSADDLRACRAALPADARGKLDGAGLAQLLEVMTWQTAGDSATPR
jgi:hypothetical protein